MQVTKKDLPKSQVELTVELSVEEFAPYILKGAEKVSKEVKIEGFRPGKVPFDVLKQKVGEMAILEEAAHVAIHKSIDDVVEKNTMGRQAIGQPQVNVTKLAPGNSFEFKLIVSMIPEIALGKYKDLNIKAEVAIVDAAELEKSLHDLQEMRATEVLADREVQMGDKVVVDIKMFLDNVPLEDGQHKELGLLLGKDYFVPGFDKKLVGAKKGDVKKFSLPYPDDHHQKNIAGKMVEFGVDIKEVFDRILPELNDEFAGFFQLKDMDELKKNLEESLLHEKKHRTDLKNESELLMKIIEDTKFGEMPEEIIQSELKSMLAELEQSVIRQGGKFDDYLSSLKKDRAGLMLEMAPNAVKRVKSALVIRELAIVEKIAPTEHEIHEKIDELKKQYADKKDVMKMLEEPGYHTYLSNILTNEKVITKLKEWNYASTGAK